ncbi:DUF4175 family protein [Reichenbachiella sp. 5M10]|uniref:DUF4175 family protein n=1 Tax=Reichenbachiella sp. 5M10 TaxID=1889772 RepID=UPI00117BDE68|nr:DUF4175 family protein [Reichenbachiella sp. 5M10]
MIIPHFLTESTHRIIHYDKEYNDALFHVKPAFETFVAFKNEPFTIEMVVEGEAVPDQFYLKAHGKTNKMKFSDATHINYQYPRVQNDFSFQILAGNYKSKTYTIEVRSRPDIKNLNIQLQYPPYTGLENTKISNNGNLTVPEGTTAHWTIESIESNGISLQMTEDTIEMQSPHQNQFTAYKQLLHTQDYQIQLRNQHGKNKQPISYQIDVIKDQFPIINLQTISDTTLYQYVIVTGSIMDDYGFSSLEFIYEVHEETKRLPMQLVSSHNAQNFFYQLSLDSIDLHPGEILHYYVRVYDNDAINGYKPARSQKHSFKLPDNTEIDAEIEKTAAQAKSDIHRTLDKAEDIREQIEEIQRDLKKNNNNNWQEKKKINTLLQDKKGLEKDIQQLAKKHKELTEKQNKFHKPNPELQKKSAQLQKLMEDILDEETKKLYEELQKLLQDDQSKTNLDELMQDIQQKEKNLEKEIERALEMFKRMQFDYKMDEIIQDLDQLKQQQSDLAQETGEKDTNLETTQENQEELNQKFDQLQEEIDKLEELNEKLSQPEKLDDLSTEQEEINQTQEEINQSLEQGKRKKSQEQQQKAAEQIESLSNQMKSMQTSMEMEMLQENLDHLRDILDNLLKLSFDQEDLMEEFKAVNQSDPRFVSLSQLQLKLRDDAVIIEDSLLSLASRVFQIQSFVTRELDAMNNHIEASLQGMKDRKKNDAVVNQQYTMTSINNLALLLNDVLQQLQQQMAESMGMPQPGQKGKKKPMPSMSQLQQELSKKIQDLKKSGKTGKPLSQELAELAAEQEMIRQQLQQIENELNNGDQGLSNNLKDIIKKMEQTETDLVNKNITQQTIQRQQDILTKMLQSEDALRERELDQQREAQTAQEEIHNTAKKYEEYIKTKQSELELLQTLPPKMNPYYKEEVNKYFQRLNEQ